MAHNHIVANLLREMGSYLKGKSCKVLPSDMRVTIPSGKAYMYPDVIIYCGQPELENARFRSTLKNPVVIFEILSASTEQAPTGGEKVPLLPANPFLPGICLLNRFRRMLYGNQSPAR